MLGDDRAFLTAASEIVATLDEVPSPAALLDELGVVRWQNRVSLALRGSRTGRHFAVFISPADAAEAQQTFEAVLGGGAPVEMFLRATDASNAYVALVSRWNAIEMRDGTRVVVVLSLGDLPVASALAGRDMARPAALTRRQLEVLRLLDAGRSTAEIARELTLSETTVRNHIANLLAALGSHSRLEAVAVARGRGILPE